MTECVPIPEDEVKKNVKIKKAIVATTTRSSPLQFFFLKENTKSNDCNIHKNRSLFRPSVSVRRLKPFLPSVTSRA